jgi:hypothetical protein
VIMDSPDEDTVKSVGPNLHYIVCLGELWADHGVNI